MVFRASILPPVNPGVQTHRLEKYIFGMGSAVPGIGFPGLCLQMYALGWRGARFEVEVVVCVTPSCHIPYGPVSYYIPGNGYSNILGNLPGQTVTTFFFLATDFEFCLRTLVTNGWIGIVLSQDRAICPTTNKISISTFRVPPIGWPWWGSSP